jgi:hypothetical protein
MSPVKRMWWLVRESGLWEGAGVEERANLQPSQPQPAELAPQIQGPVGLAPVSLPLLGRAGGMRGAGAGLARARLVVGMQAGYGNAAVSRAVLAREEGERARKIAAFNASKGKNWGDAAEILNGFNDEDIERLLAGLTKQQLRQLDAGAMRQIPSFAGRVHGPIMARLGKQPGQVFGRLTFLPGSPENGGGPLTAYALPVDFSFAPDADIVRATEIAYVQTVRLVHTGTNDTAEWEDPAKARQTDDKWTVDRAAGGASGFAGYQTDAQPGPYTTQWSPDHPDSFATYHDRPSAQIPSTDWSFETAVVAKGGADTGVIYASCSWGFSVDENCVLTPKAHKTEDKPSAAFGAAVAKWNQQAAGPVAERNAPGQEALPAVR